MEFDFFIFHLCQHSPECIIFFSFSSRTFRAKKEKTFCIMPDREGLEKYKSDFIKYNLYIGIKL